MKCALPGCTKVLTNHQAVFCSVKHRDEYNLRYAQYYRQHAQEIQRFQEEWKERMHDALALIDEPPSPLDDL